MNKRLSILAAAAVAIACQGISTADLPAETNWYGRSFFLLHLDHHTTDKMEVGRDADPAETARLINLWTRSWTAIGPAGSGLTAPVSP
jgi:hypothetical protein